MNEYYLVFTDIDINLNVKAPTEEIAKFKAMQAVNWYLINLRMQEWPARRNYTEKDLALITCELVTKNNDHPI